MMPLLRPELEGAGTEVRARPPAQRTALRAGWTARERCRKALVLCCYRDDGASLLQRCFGSPAAAPRGVGGACCGLGTARIAVRCLRVCRREAGGMGGEAGGGGVVSWAPFQRPKDRSAALSRPASAAVPAVVFAGGSCPQASGQRVLARLLQHDVCAAFGASRGPRARVRRAGD